jgi:Flp pilus assembly protein TadD
VPTDAWAWCYRARAAAELGETNEARSCCREAIRLEAIEGEETHAADLLVSLDDA